MVSVKGEALVKKEVSVAEGLNQGLCRGRGLSQGRGLSRRRSQLRKRSQMKSQSKKRFNQRGFLKVVSVKGEVLVKKEVSVAEGLNQGLCSKKRSQSRKSLI